MSGKIDIFIPSAEAAATANRLQEYAQGIQTATARLELLDKWAMWGRLHDRFRARLGQEEGYKIYTYYTHINLYVCASGRIDITIPSEVKGEIMADSKRQKQEAQGDEPTVSEPPVLVEEPVKEGDAPPPLVEKPLANPECGEYFGHTHEGVDALHRRYISNMVSRWPGSDYESSDDANAPWKRYREIE